VIDIPWKRLGFGCLAAIAGVLGGCQDSEIALKKNVMRECLRPMQETYVFVATDKCFKVFPEEEFVGYLQFRREAAYFCRSELLAECQPNNLYSVTFKNEDVFSYALELSSEESFVGVKGVGHFIDGVGYLSAFEEKNRGGVMINSLHQQFGELNSP